MKQAVSITQRTALKQTLSYQQRQSLAVLQMSNVELDEHIRQQVEENPFLIYETIELNTSESQTKLQTAPSSRTTDFTSDVRNLSDIIPDHQQTLHQTLLQDIRLHFHDPEELRLAAELTYRLNEDGYLEDSFDEIAEDTGFVLSDISDMLAQLQEMGPPGLFARNLAECLTLQLRACNRLDPAMSCMMEHLDLVAQMDWSALRKKCGVETEDILDMWKELRQLDPRPGRQIAAPSSQLVYPDIRIEKEGSRWNIRVMSHRNHELIVDKTLEQDLKHMRLSEQDRTFIRENKTKARNLHQAVTQRQSTLQGLAEILFRTQHDFFKLGPSALKPMSQKQCAMWLELHESTVSRAVRDKHVETPFGTFPIQYFFSSSLQGSDQQDVSARKVHDRIRTLINNEPPEAVLSDDSISELLQAEGISAARRTVAKYREAMNIPKSSQRRKIKKMRKLLEYSEK